MDCRRGSTTLDLCSEPECVSCTVRVDGVVHLPNHGVFKVRRFVFDRDLGKVGDAAKDALNSAREIISRLKKKEKEMPDCVQCKRAVSLPCWCCVECAGECRTIEMLMIDRGPEDPGWTHREFHMLRL